MKNIYVLHDSKAKMYHTPFYMVNDDACLRTMVDMVNNQENEVSKFPEDFTLFNIGTFDEETANIELLQERVTICRCHELIQ